MPKAPKIKRKAKVKQGLRDPNAGMNDGISKSFKQGKQTSRERWFSSWLKKGASSGKKNNNKGDPSNSTHNNNPVDKNNHTLKSKKRQRGEQGESQEPRRRTAKDRYCDSGQHNHTTLDGKKSASLANAASAAARSKNPLADKRADESLSDFQIRKAKEQRSIIAREEFNSTKRADKSKKYHANKILKNKKRVQDKKNKGYDSEEDEWNAAAGVRNTRAVAFGERIDDAPRFKNMPYKGRGKAKKKKVVTLLEDTEGGGGGDSAEGSGSRKKKSDLDQMALLRQRVVDAYRQNKGHHHTMGVGSQSDKQQQQNRFAE